jgi:FkbM family methyltransferase
MRRPRCAVAILPAEGGDAGRSRASIAAAEGFGAGDFGSVAILPVSGERDARRALEEAARVAEADGFAWMLALSAAEVVSADIFVKAAPALRLHDAIWGGAGVVTRDHPDPKVERASRLAAQNLVTFFHAALGWWIGPSHFVRTAAALRALQADETSAWYADYMIELWRGGRAYKTAQRLTLFQETLPPVPDHVRARLIEHLARRPVFMDVRHDAFTARLPYTGLNPLIEGEQMRGLFFEAEELRFLVNRVPRGLNIVDVGANTGNHTVFFAMVMQGARVVAIEPEARAAAALRACVAENTLPNVDLTRLGKAVGAGEGRLRAILSMTAGLGATHFVPDPLGDVGQLPLDGTVDRPIDLLKIDAEGMEMAVLAGAAGLIAACRPALYIEILDERIAEFMAWVDSNGYRIEKLFPDKTHCNYFLTAKERS